jgi:2,5-diketo-D-gluconate reductase B
MMFTIDARGASIPALGLGTWEMRGRTCRRAVEHALGIGYRHIDTARFYRNEEEVGAAIRSVARDEVFLVTKIWTNELTRDRVGPALADSLRKLGTDYVDLLLVHWPNRRVEIAETMEAMGAEQAAGRVHYLGVSNFSAPMLQEAMRHGEIVCDQIEYHPFVSQDEVVSFATAAGVAIVAYCPLARGLVLKDRTLQAIALHHGKSTAQVTLRWLVQQHLVAAIPKSENPERIEEDFDIFDFELSGAEMDRIGELARGQLLVSPDLRS